MNLRIEMMERLARGERITDLCREYGISRKTGDKFKKRFEQLGAAGLADQSRAPRVIPHKTPPEIEELIVAERKQHPSWGPKKLKAVLERKLGKAFPSVTAVANVLHRHGLVQPRKKRPRYVPTPTTLRVARAPNEVWCIDYKGHFRLGDASYCYPLTVTDQFSRYLLCCEGMSAISDEAAREACRELFATYGLPTTMRSDNGVPFASNGLAGLTKLSAYWLRLGIELERIRPAHPEENGQHERMHRTLKLETTRPARHNLLQQQERFDDFRDEFNRERPHEALSMKCPADVFASSKRRLPAKLPEFSYATHDDVLKVNAAGQIYIAGIGGIPVSSALVGEHVGIREEDDGRWLVSFGPLDLGHVGPNRGDKMLMPCSTSSSRNEDE